MAEPDFAKVLAGVPFPDNRGFYYAYDAGRNRVVIDGHYMEGSHENLNPGRRKLVGVFTVNGPLGKRDVDFYSEKTFSKTKISRVEAYWDKFDMKYISVEQLRDSVKS